MGVAPSSESGSWATVQSWKDTMDTIKTQYNTLAKDTRKQKADMEVQSSRLELDASTAFQRRDELIDAAYEALERFVSELLTYADGNADIGSKAVPSLPIVVECFRCLADFCEGVVDRQTLEAVESTQEIGEDSQIVQQIKQGEGQLRTALDGLSTAAVKAREHFDVQHEHHMAARAALEQAEGRKSDFFYSIFGDSGVDDAVNSCRENENTWHSTADDAWAIWDHLRNLHSQHQALLYSDLSQLASELTVLADGMRTNYAKIGDSRKVDRECWIAARSLQYHVTTNNEYTSRDDALRHVFKLIDTVNVSIDSDEDVIRLKAAIERSVLESLGRAKADELRREKSFTPIRMTWVFRSMFVVVADLPSAGEE
ncbi:hypothetical protein KVT40_004699 [Elsinoe batatas]|uniref:Uncharacterized protein n=1 Tax=Elsinoe batatas TaxID=2601811 RepID=A0A8K0L3V1_9PEZI|nr:hypothetical protein KVT40_004699 [Elsinoe batatas]